MRKKKAFLLTQWRLNVHAAEMFFFELNARHVYVVEFWPFG